MKKLVVVAAVFVLVGLIWFSQLSKNSPSTTVASLQSTPSTTTSVTPMAGNPGTTSTNPSEVATRLRSPKLTPGVGAASEGDEEIDEAAESESMDTRPAAEVYTSAQEALDAIKQGAKDYDDVILEQFTTPGENCTWCPEFYGMVKEVLGSTDTPQDQKSYYAEILAISGKTDNVQNLVDSVKNAKSSDEADLYAEALELSVGKDDVTKILGDSMNSTNDTLKEAATAAVTNQGSRLAADLLIKATIDRGDPDGFYSTGVGLGEMIPEDEAVPSIQQLVQRHDQFSHLGVKALLNRGLSGLKVAFDELENVTDAQTFKNMTKDALDHVNYEEGLEEFLSSRIATSKNPQLADFAKGVQEEFKEDDQNQ